MKNLKMLFCLLMMLCLTSNIYAGTVPQPSPKADINWSFIIWSGVLIWIFGAFCFVIITRKDEIKKIISQMRNKANPAQLPNSSHPTKFRFVDVPRAIVASVVHPVLKDLDEENTIMREERDGEVTFRFLKSLSTNHPANDCLVITNGDPDEAKPEAALYFQRSGDFIFLNINVLKSSTIPGWGFTSVTDAEVNTRIHENGEMILDSKFINLSPTDPKIATRIGETELYCSMFHAKDNAELFMILLIDTKQLGYTTYFGFNVGSVEFY